MENKMVHLVIRMPEDFHRLIKSTAYKEGSCLKKWVTEILKRALEDKNKK